MNVCQRMFTNNITCYVYLYVFTSFSQKPLFKQLVDIANITCIVSVLYMRFNWERITLIILLV